MENAHFYFLWKWVYSGFSNRYLFLVEREVNEVSCFRFYVDCPTVPLLLTVSDHVWESMSLLWYLGNIWIIFNLFLTVKWVQFDSLLLHFMDYRKHNKIGNTSIFNQWFLNFMFICILYCFFRPTFDYWDISIDFLLRSKTVLELIAILNVKLEYALFHFVILFAIHT